MPTTAPAPPAALLLAACALAPAPAAQCALGSFTAADTSAGDSFGQVVAIRGSDVLVGVPLDDPAGALSGSVQVFAASSQAVFLQSLTAGDAAVGDGFGSALALGVDRALVGAPLADGVGFNSGAAYVFERGPSGWSETAVLAPAALAAGDGFGHAVALSGDRALVGAPFDGGAGAQAGAAYVFERTPAGWALEAELGAATGKASDRFGSAVALDGDVALVGAYLDDDGGLNTGSASLFERGPGGWVQTAQLLASARKFGAEFGVAVALSGGRALVGAPGEDAAYVFEEGPGGWSEVARLTAAAAAAGDDFGRSVALDGDWAAVGAPHRDDLGLSAGAAYLFRRDAAGWGEAAVLQAAGGAAGDQHGHAVALSGDRVVSGAWKADAAGTNSGAAHLWRTPGSGCLSGDVGVLSVAAGGTQAFALEAGAPLGSLPYLLLGSLSGSWPGFPIDGELLPLNVDAYTLTSLLAPNAPPLSGSFGVLDAQGQGAAAFSLPPSPALTALVGLELNHAFLAVELLPGLLHVPHASNAVPLQLGP